jgi:hypothetical protein
LAAHLTDIVREPLAAAPIEAALYRIGRLGEFDRYQASSGIEAAADLVAEWAVAAGWIRSRSPAIQQTARRTGGASKPPVAWTPTRPPNPVSRSARSMTPAGGCSRSFPIEQDHDLLDDGVVVEPAGIATRANHEVGLPIELEPGAELVIRIPLHEFYDLKRDEDYSLALTYGDDSARVSAAARVRRS